MLDTDLKRLAVWVGNGKVGVASNEDLEVAFIDADGSHIEIVLADSELLKSRFQECLEDINENPTNP